MLEHLSSITDLPIGDIRLEPTRLRGVAEAEVDALGDLIREFGQTTPILVRRKKAGFFLVDGLHRLEATRRCGLTTIPVRVYTMTDDEAQMLEASQNLVGGLSPLDDAVFLAAWKQAHLRKYPETAKGVAGAMAKHGLQVNSSSFAEIVAVKRAVSVRQAYKIIAAGEKLTRQDLDLLRQAKRPPTLKDVEDFGKIADPEERAMVILRFSVGNAKSARAARRTLAEENGDVQRPVKDPVEAGFNALMNAWARAKLAAKKRFLLEMAQEVWEAQNKGVPLNKWAEAAEE